MKRIDAHKSSPQARGPVHDFLQVREITDPPIPTRADCIEIDRESPCPFVLRSGREVAGVRSYDESDGFSDRLSSSGKYRPGMTELDHEFIVSDVAKRSVGEVNPDISVAAEGSYLFRWQVGTWD